MGYYVRLRRNGQKVGELGPFRTQAQAVRQAQPLADDAARGVVVTVEPQRKRANPKPKAQRRRTGGPVLDLAGFRALDSGTGASRQFVRKSKPPTKRTAAANWVRESGYVVTGRYLAYPSRASVLAYGDRLYGRKSKKKPSERAQWVLIGPFASKAAAEAVARSAYAARAYRAEINWRNQAIAEFLDRRRNPGTDPQRPGTPPLATTEDLVDWSPMNERTARSMERMGMAPRKKNRRKKATRSNRSRSGQLKLFGKR